MGRTVVIQMIHPSRILLTATFSLLSVLTVHAANAQLATTQAAKTSTIPISYLPFTITAPGTYVLTRNLTFNSFTDTAITISAGSVILDLKGYTILNTYQAPPASGGASTGVEILHGPTTNNVTVRNGTIKNFYNGVNSVNLTATYYLYISNVQINQMVFTSTFLSKGVVFQETNSSSVTNCTFVQSNIVDYQSQGGNRYSNDSLLACSMGFSNDSDPNNPASIPLLLDNCLVAPASN
jgi:hypothetical protein